MIVSTIRQLLDSEPGPVEAVAGTVSAVYERIVGGEGTGTEALVCQDIADRQRIGIQKYGTTVEKNRLTVSQWARHAYEEALDLPIYLKRLTGSAEALERELENMKAERNRWRNLCNRLHNALRFSSDWNGAGPNDELARIVTDAMEAFQNAHKSETKPTLERTQAAVILGETKEP